MLQKMNRKLCLWLLFGVNQSKNNCIHFSLLKYEEVWFGDWRKLLVKNITGTDYTTFSCEARGEKLKAKLVTGK